MATLQKTNVDLWVPELWNKEALLARQESHFMAERVMGVMKAGMKRGDKVHIPHIGNLYVNNVGGDGSISPQAPTESEYTVTVNLWREASVDISDEAEDEVVVEGLQSKYASKIGHALARDIEDELLALYPNLYTNGQYATEANNITDVMIVQGIVKLDDADVPDDDRYMIVRPIQRGELLKIDKFINRDYNNKQPVVSRVLGEIYGMPVLRSTRVKRADYDSDATTESVNLMWHLEAFGIALQNEVKTKKLDQSKLSTTVVGHHRFGVNNIRIDHAVILPTVN